MSLWNEGRRSMWQVQFCCFLRWADFLIFLLGNSSFKVKSRISWGKDGWGSLPCCRIGKRRLGGPLDPVWIQKIKYLWCDPVCKTQEKKMFEVEKKRLVENDKTRTVKTVNPSNKQQANIGLLLKKVCKALNHTK